MGLSVDGATALVTGASSGIGAALAVELAARGATVGLAARRADRLEAVLERCRHWSPRSRHWVVDLADPDAAEALATDAWARFGHLDLVVNNAAIPRRRVATELTAADLDELVRVDYLSPARLCLAVLGPMLERGTGMLVNVSSLGGRLGIPHEAAYCGAKFALCGFTECLALDLWDTPVEVRLIVPGPVDTEIWDRPGNEAPLYDGPKEPPERVAAAIVAAIEGDAFETYTPDLKGVVEFKTSDIDGFLAGAAALGRS